MNGFNRALAHLSHALRRHTADADEQRVLSDGPMSDDSTPNWHGDHWQSLLSNPMDARRYILEDWTETFDRRTDADDSQRIDSFSGRPVRHYRYS